MKARCVAAVSAELGRPLAAAEARTIEQRIGDAMRREARKSPETWTALPLQDQLRMGAEIAAKELVAEAQLKRLRVGKQIEAWDRVSNYLDQQIADRPRPRTRAAATAATAARTAAVVAVVVAATRPAPAAPAATAATARRTSSRSEVTRWHQRSESASTS